MTSQTNLSYRIKTPSFYDYQYDSTADQSVILAQLMDTCFEEIEKYVEKQNASYTNSFHRSGAW